jgi:5-methylthioribose kinase
MEFNGICAVVVDVEGTTSSVAFVKEHLYPYARRYIPEYVREHATAIQDILDDVRRIEGNATLEIPQLVAVLLHWMDDDRKITPLKALQGLVWQRGFDSGALHAPVYEDAVRALEVWHKQGLKLYVYSSGSVAAQRLLFSHTEHGDLTPLFFGHFDTTTGSKLEAQSFRTIAGSIGLPAEAILFLSDHPGEIEAAVGAGMQALLVDRDSVPASTVQQGRIRSFDAIVLPDLSRRTERPAAPHGYRTLTPDTVADYVQHCDGVADRLGGLPARWKAQEIGDGNLNLIFVVEGTTGAVVVKQALPYVRMVGDSWPLPLSRSHFEHRALTEQTKWAAPFVPELYHADSAMALIVMEYLSAHTVLRKGLIKGVCYPRMAEHLGTFLARTLFHTSDLSLNAAEKKRGIANFLGNAAMCKISEDLIFDEPYFAAPMNRHTSPQLDPMASALRTDLALKLAVQEMKWCFQNAPEALLHGDLHTGSVMVTDTDTRVIDPEFAFYGPMGFDLGAIIGNLLLAFFSRPGHEGTGATSGPYQKYLLDQIRVLWETFEQSFTQSWRDRSTAPGSGDIYQPRLCVDTPELPKRAIDARMAAIWNQTLGFAGCKMIRRIVGLSHVEDFESIADAEMRAACERRVLNLARELLVCRGGYASVGDVTDAAVRIT